MSKLLSILAVILAAVALVVAFVVPGPMGSQGVPGDKGDTGDRGPIGLTGDTGATGRNCWDLNGNGIPDVATEDLNGDGVVNVADCGFPRVAVSNMTMSGIVSARYVPPSSNMFFLVAASYPVPLPTSTPQPTLEYVPGAGSTTANCPGYGQALPGILCIYAYNVNNIDRVAWSGGSVDTYWWGFSLDVFPTVSANPGWIIANWAYTVP